MIDFFFKKETVPLFVDVPKTTNTKKYKKK